MQWNLWHIRFFTLVLLLIAVLPLFANGERPECGVCGMWIDQYRHTRHVITVKDEVQVMFCSLTCTAKYLKTHRTEMNKLQVADYLTAELIDTNQAIYLVGSDAPPVMSSTSIIAFSSEEQVEKFQEKHGGHIKKFIQVLTLE